MGKFTIYITGNNGDDVPQKMSDWDGEDDLEFRLSGFSDTAVISIERNREKQDD